MASKMKSCHLFSTVLLAAALLSGCGGSGSSNANPTTPIKFSVDWAGRTRNLAGPSSALSLKITLTGAAPTVGDFTVTVDRNATLAAHTESYTSTTSSKRGTFQMTAQFFSGAGGTGDVVAHSSTSVTIKGDGTGIGNLTTVSDVGSLAVDANQTVPMPGTTQLTFTAKNTEGATITISPGSAGWAVVDGADILSVTPDGIATGLKSGTAHVKVNVDGVSSPVVAVTVPEPPAFQNGDFQSPAMSTGDWQQANGSPWFGQGGWGVANGSNQWGDGGHDSSQFAYIRSKTLSPGVGKLSQQVNGLVVGRKYQVSFWLRRRSGGASYNGIDPNKGATLEVYKDNATLLITPEPDDTWTKYTTPPFIATATMATFTFSPTLPFPSGDKCDLIDDVTLEPVLD